MVRVVGTTYYIRPGVLRHSRLNHTLHIPFLMPRSPVYYYGHLNCVISIVVATRVSNQQPAILSLTVIPYVAAKSNRM